MKRDLVQLWVTKETRQAVKVKAAEAGTTVVDYLEVTFIPATADGMPLGEVLEVAGGSGLLPPL